MVSNAPGEVYGLASASLNLRVLGFALAVSVVSILVAGLIPAIQSSKLDVTIGLKDGARATTPKRRLLLDLLVAVEVALTLVLLLGTGLLTRTLVQLSRVDPGFTTDDILTVELAARDAFVASRGRGPQPTVYVSAREAQRIWPDGTALGRRIRS